MLLVTLKGQMMVKFLTVQILLIGLFSNPAFSQSNADPFTRDLVLISKWFEGTFDNDSQIWFENDRRWGGKEGHKHRQNHAIHLPLEMPELGEHVFYVEEYFDNDPTKVWRQRIVSFHSQPPKGIRMKLYFLSPDAAKLALKSGEEITNKLSIDKLSNVETCDVWFKRNGSQFEGKMDDKACVFGEGEKRRYSEHNLTLSEDKYWRIDRTWLFSNGEIYKGHLGDEPSKMRRAKNYNCQVSMPYVSYAEPHEKDVALKGLLVHNQGGSAQFENPRTNKTFELQLREKEYPYYKQGADFFLLRLKEVGAKYSAALVTTAPNPERLSVNIGNMSAYCERQ